MRCARTSVPTATRTLPIVADSHPVSFLLDSTSVAAESRASLALFVPAACPDVLAALKTAPAKPASPVVIVLGGAALRVADLCRCVVQDTSSTHRTAICATSRKAKSQSSSPSTSSCRSSSRTSANRASAPPAGRLIASPSSWMPTTACRSVRGPFRTIELIGSRAPLPRPRRQSHVHGLTRPALTSARRRRRQAARPHGSA